MEAGPLIDLGLPHAVLFRLEGAVLSPNEYLKLRADTECRAMNAARISARDDRPWRQEAAQRLRLLDHDPRARSVENCREIWVAGHAFVCRAPYCLSCLGYRLRRLAQDDAERLRGRCHGILCGVVATPRTPITTRAWYGTVLGYRKLWLYGAETYLWVAVSDRPDVVEHHLGIKVRRAALAELPTIYTRVLSDMSALGPASAVNRILARGKFFHPTAAGGLFRTKLKRRRRVPVARL